MMHVIIGGSGSGKSAYAENCLEELMITGQKYYLATMQVYDDEGRCKVARHKKLREGKGFVTIEQLTNIEQALGKMKSGQKAVLLECMSNLVANEMFADEAVQDGDSVVSKILSGIETLKVHVQQFIIVTNNVFEDGITYDDSTMEYLRALGIINQRLVEMAEEATEVVVGIPVVLKKGNGL